MMKKIPVLHEDGHCLVLNKPPGLAVQGGEGVNASLDSILAKEFLSPTRPLLVHRLDKDTSGVILTAKTPDAAAFFSKIIAGRRAVKRYLAVCRTPASPERAQSGVIKTELVIKGIAKHAETAWKILRETHDDDETWTLFELELGTGRMHQIRRSLAQEGFPILGDDKYGDFKLNKQLRKERGLKNLLLHSSRLIIPLPDGGMLDVCAPPPEYFDLLLQDRTLREQKMQARNTAPP
ncbi:MAG: RluA family pseudouridine synthase [Spirochaetaceae bacterium]|jgi:23S rRNA pseudouridine955/2504/2580 synthase|nr:RluA family pseudouridine synthase [Spirochaetaceae bacterium]